MGRSTSIADVGMSIVKLLRRELVPDTLQNPDAVGLCSPTDRGLHGGDPPVLISGRARSCGSTR